MSILNVVVEVWGWLVWLYGYLDWSLVTGWAVAIVTGALAYAAFRQIKLLGKAESRSAKQVELLEKQVDLLRLERDLAMRPNISIRVYGVGSSSSSELDVHDVFIKEPLYFTVRNMSTRPFEYIGGFIYMWDPRAQFSVADVDRSDAVTFLAAESPSLYIKGQITEDTYFEPGDSFVLIPTDKEAALKLLPTGIDDDSYFVISLSVAYPEAPGGIAFLIIPFFLHAMKSDSASSSYKWVGWPIYEELSVRFPALNSQINDNS